VPPLPGFRTHGSPEARRRILLVLFPSAELGFQASQPPPDFDLTAVGLSGLAKRAALRRRSFSIFPPAGALSECPSLSVSHEARRSPCPVLDRRSTARPRSSFNRGAPCFFHTYPGLCAGLIFLVLLRRAQPPPLCQDLLSARRRCPVIGFLCCFPSRKLGFGAIARMFSLLSVGHYVCLN
jgi:hypothetical protein